MKASVFRRVLLPAASITVLVLAVFAGAVLADSFAINFESYTPGTVNGQDGWSSTGPFDQAIVNNSVLGAPGSFGARSLRISNSVVSGSFGDQTFSRSLANDAGEASAVSGGWSGGTRQPFFDAQFDIASVVPAAEQPGLRVVVSPDRGDGARMGYVGISDTPTGLSVDFYDYPDAASGFVFTTVETGLDRSQPHTIRVTMSFKNGPADAATPANDIVCVFVDGVLQHQGTSWENYFREPSVNPSPITHPVDSLLFRVSGSAAPATAGNGFLIDNLRLTSGPIPAGFESGCTPAIAPTTPPANTTTATGEPLPLCALFGGGTNPIVRADADANQFCRILVEQGNFVQNAAEVGDAALISAGIRQAVDIFEFNAGGERVTVFDRPLTVCLQGSGQFYFRDATGQPRTTALLPSTMNGEYTCATISHAGTVVLAGS